MTEDTRARGGVAEDPLAWKVLSRRKLLDCRIFELGEVESESPKGKRGRFIVLDAPDWVSVVPLIETERGPAFLMVRQFRHGTGTSSLEFPGGVVEAGEDPRSAVLRELREETGYSASKVTRLGAVRPNPAFIDNVYHVFLAEGLAAAGAQELDEHEELEVEIVPIKEARRALEEDSRAHALMVVALALYDRTVSSGQRPREDIPS
jgi:ADP-ribose pyrophosphatase